MRRSQHVWVIVGLGLLIAVGAFNGGSIPVAPLAAGAVAVIVIGGVMRLIEGKD